MRVSECLKYLEPYGACNGLGFHVVGVGVDEPMKAGVVDRPGGVASWLLMHFHDPVIIEVGGERDWYPAGTFIVWKATDGHYFGNPNAGWSHSWTHFISGDAIKILRGGGLPVNVPFLYRNRDELNRLLSHIYFEASSRKAPDERIMRHLVETLSMSLGRAYREDRDGLEIPERIMAVKRHIEANLGKRLTLRDLAMVSRTSIPSLCLEFKRHVGKAPIQYLIETRLLQARYLLRDMGLSVGEVASLVGYDDQFQFSKIFKKRFGICPRNDRKTLLNASGHRCGVAR